MKTYDNKQREAINANNGHYLVLAGPGCGKTDILAERVAEAMANNVKAEDMLCLTFTNRASRGMRERVEQRTGIADNSVFIGNVHRYCSQFLSTNGLIGENTGIIDENESTDILVDMDTHYFTLQAGGVDKMRTNQACKLSNYIAQRQLNHPEQLLDGNFNDHYRLAEKMDFSIGKLKEHLYENNPVVGKMLIFALQYTEYKRAHDIIDFADLLALTYHHLSNDTTGRYKRYKWVQVDEIQDLNPIQMAIIDLLTDTTGAFTAMYLGDEQQAIFSFMGAKLSQLDMLKQRCDGHILNLGNNYRSPKYLLDIFNTFACKELNVSPELLPVSNNCTPCNKHDLIYTSNATTDDEEERVLKMIQYYSQFGDHERIAILVPTNAAADRLSIKLCMWNIAHFKISGTDMFKTASFKTLAAIISIVSNNFNTMAWSRLLQGIGSVGSGASARKLLTKLKELMMNPLDLLSDSSYVSRFNDAFENEEMVYFDTETTGLNVLEDDIVQIAAFKVRNGKIVDNSSFNVFIETEKSIPEKLGDITNPLVEAYNSNPHLSKKEALQQFIEYAGNCRLLGHNVTFDYLILQNNISRYLNKKFKADTIDSLYLAKLVFPRLSSYKLKDLLSTLHIEGENTHLADDDIAATYNLVKLCHEQSRHIADMQRQFKHDIENTHITERLNMVYPILEHLTAHKHLRISASGFHLAKALQYIYEQLLELALVNDMGSKFDSFIRFAESEWIGDANGLTLGEQIHAHANDISASMGEGDLVNSSDLVKERVFVMTIHKGKGLEFDNVILLGANNGTYPFYKTNNILSRPEMHTAEQVKQAQAERMEDARKFYVAISRAKKRLCISYANINSYNKAVSATPFMNHIAHYFNK